jgi:hypothetical protein
MLILLAVYFPMKKQPFPLTILLFFCTISLANAQQFNWIKGGWPAGAGWTDEPVKFISTDAHNNVYVAAKMGDNNIVADSFRALNGNGLSTELFASYRCDGLMRWAKIIYGDYQSDCAGTAYDGVNSIYYLGFIASSNKHIGNDTVFDEPFSYSILIRFDTSGKLKWLRNILPDTTGAYGSPGVNAVQVDKSGKVHVFVYEYAGMPISSTISVTRDGSYEIIYDSTGNVQSAVRLQIDTEMYINRAFLVRQTDTTFAWITNNADHLHYLAEFEPDGSQIWADTARATSSLSTASWINGVAIDKNGNPVVVGYGLSFILGEDTAYYDSSQSTIIKLNDAGHMLWHFNINGQPPNAITVLGNGNVAATGNFAGWAIHNTDTLLDYGALNTNSLFCLLDSNGNLIYWDYLRGGPEDGYGTAITHDNLDNIYFGGLASDTVRHTGMNTYFHRGGGNNFYIAKYGSCNCTPETSISSFFTKNRTDTVQFNYWGSSADSLHWYFGDGTDLRIIPDPLHPVNPVIHVYKNKATYTVCVTAYGCNDSAMYCDTVSALNVKNFNQLQSQFSIYPVPAQNEIFISNAEGQYIIADIAGRILLTGTVSSGKPVNVTMLTAGLYFIMLTDKQGIKTNLRFLKQ